MYENLQPLGIPIPSWKKIYETSPCVSAFLGPLYFTFGWMVELVFATKTSRLLLLSGHRCRDSAPPFANHLLVLLFDGEVGGP